MSYPLFDGFCLMGRYGLDNAEDTCSVSCHLLMLFAIIADQRNQGTNCNGLKLRAADGKMRLTDVVDTEQRKTLL